MANVAGPESCTTNIFWGPNEAGYGSVANGTGDGCTILYTDTVRTKRIQQIALNFTIGQTAYIVVSMADKDGATQSVAKVTATE